MVTLTKENLKLGAVVAIGTVAVSSAINCLGVFGVRKVMDLTPTYSGALAAAGVTGFIGAPTALAVGCALSEYDCFAEGRTLNEKETTQFFVALAVASVVVTVITTVAIPNLPSSLMDHQLTYLEGAAYGVGDSVACPAVLIAYLVFWQDN